MRQNREPNSERPPLLVHRAIIINPTGQFLIVQRSKNDRYLPGYWEFPGGKMEQGENLTQCLENEVREETGLEIEMTSPLAYFDSSVLGPESYYPDSTYVVVISVAKTASPNVTISEEHDDYKWITTSEVNNYQFKKEDISAIEILSDLLSTFSMKG